MRAARLGLIATLGWLAMHAAGCGDDADPSGAADAGSSRDARSGGDARAGDDARVPGRDAGPRGPTSCAEPTDVGALADRVPDDGWPDLEWEDPYPGGWQTIDVTTRGVTPGSGDVAPALQALVDELEAPTILDLPAGTYELHTPVAMRGDLIVRGAGPASTRIELVGTNQAFTWEGVGGQWSWGWIDEDFQPRNVLEDVPPGGDTIRLDSTAGLAAGDVVMVAESLEDPTFPSATLGKGGVFEIVAITGDSITLDLPLAIGLRTQNGAGEPTVVAKVQPIANGGIEGLHLVSPVLTSYDRGVLDLYLADNVYVRNIVSTLSFGADVLVSVSRRVLIADSFFDRTQGSPPDGGECLWVDALATQVAIVDNVFREKQQPLLAQVGGSFVVYAYNFHVDRLADYCHETADPSCRDLDWIRSPETNGISRGWHGIQDIVFHGNYPHHYLVEGNVFYNAVFDYHHRRNGPGTTLFRNRIHGNSLADWMNGYGIWIDGDSDGENLVGNVLLHDSIITFAVHNGPRAPMDTFVAANTLSGNVDWGDLAPGTTLPPSLYRSCPPSFWPTDLPWPPFGPDVPGSATARIPAQLRYEQIVAAE